MLRGFYTAASGMIAQQRQQEILSNNIANANTPGYQADQAVLRSFPELLLQQMGSKNIPTENGLKIPENRVIGGLTTGVYAQEAIPNFAQGDIRETGIFTDMALVEGLKPDETGGIFFTVQNNEGEIRYTRNGHFTVDAEGYLTTNEGYYVLNQAGNPIQTNGLDFTVTPEGGVQAAGLNTQLGLAYIADVQDLIKGENDLLQLEGDAVAANAYTSGAEFTVQQNYLESSNVNPMQSMTDMIQAYRSFELNQRVLKAYDDSMGKAVNEIARLG
ncbi:flagellar hook-basal body protein [Pseudogracilibacillus sp. SE30717A]|uniref:flagellar hook-basal body protein n=1 Tax=Pseudogracilibacillus sp. SE30717A TaxID=3098293 RepID=UPI00300DD54E